MGNAASNLPYEIGDEVIVGAGGGGGGGIGMSNPEELYGWKLHEGKCKSDGTGVTVFVAKKPNMTKTAIDARQNPNFMQLQPALHHFQHCKRLRHPYILNVLATLDTDNPTDDAGAATQQSSSKKQSNGDLIIVTESCMTLQSWLNKTPAPTQDEIAWGLECMVKALHFLHSSAKLLHGNMSPCSFMVTKAGDIKLWNFSLVSGIGSESPLSLHFKDYDNLITPISYRSQERISKQYDSINTAGIHTVDSYGLGILIPYLFNDSIPPKLQKAVQRLQTQNIKMRPRLQPLLKCPVFDTPLHKLQLQLEQLSVQSVEQKLAFWQNLSTAMSNTSNINNPHSTLSLINQGIAVYKILPLISSTISTICSNDNMLMQDFYRQEVLAIINPLFYIAENHLQPDMFDQKIKPLVVLLINVKDRAVRGAILNKIQYLEQHMAPKDLNAKVFEPLCSGFSDSSAALRELSLKASFVLVPHLNASNLEKLSRYLIRLQSDPEPSIRTNVIIFIGKLVPHLSSEVVRHKLLLPSIVRALKDTFHPCRLSALKTLIKTKDHFDPSGLASKVLPVITPMLVDPAEDVRKEAFHAVDDIVNQLRMISANMGNAQDQTQQQPQSAPSSGNHAAPSSGNSAGINGSGKVPEAPKSGGSYLSGLSSWMTSSTSSAAAPAPAAVPATVTQQPPPPIQPTPAPPAMQQPPQYQQTPSVPAPVVNNDLDMGDGWDDMDDFESSHNADDPVNNVTTSMSNTRFGSTDTSSMMMNSNNDPFAAFEMKTTTPSLRTSTGGGSKLRVPAKKLGTTGLKTPSSSIGLKTPSSTGLKSTEKKETPKPAIKKLNVDDGWGDDDGWDDF